MRKSYLYEDAPIVQERTAFPSLREAAPTERYANAQRLDGGGILAAISWTMQG
ncbi:hypothetical protein KBT16_12110 [Nostoc sp. CCCryo 231-06]|nr:hypothetical protein [Nostoc sp. CCCryo 231-06]